jgi:hypothetical protein
MMNYLRMIMFMYPNVENAVLRVQRLNSIQRLNDTSEFVALIEIQSRDMEIYSLSAITRLGLINSALIILVKE